MHDMDSLATDVYQFVVELVQLPFDGPPVVLTLPALDENLDLAQGESLAVRAVRYVREPRLCQAVFQVVDLVLRDGDLESRVHCRTASGRPPPEA